MHDKEGKTLNTMRVTTDPGVTLYSSLTSRTALCPSGGVTNLSSHGQTSRTRISTMDLRSNNSVGTKARTIFAQQTTSPFFESKRNSKRSFRESHGVSECPTDGNSVEKGKATQHEQASASSSNTVPDKEEEETLLSKETTSSTSKSDTSSHFSSATPCATTEAANSSSPQPSTVSTTLSSFLSPSSIRSTSSGSSKTPISSTSQSLPVVSVNELQGVEIMGHSRASDCRPVKVTHFTIFTEYHQNHHQLHQPMGRPQTAGPRAIVSPEHTGPVGLGKEDVVRGMKFGSYIEDHFYHQDTKREDKEDENENENKIKTGSICPVSCGDYFSRKNVSEEKIEFHSSEKLDSHVSTRPKSDYGRLHKRLHRPLCRSAIQGERTVSLELTITSIATGNRFAEENGKQDEENTGHGEQRGVRNSATYRKNTRSGQDGDFNTINGIRRSYRRAQSAPPISRSTATSYYPPNDTRAGENKTFSSLYWRAKSAYHRKNVDSNTEGNIGEDNEDPERCPSSQFRGSLLRPLLYTEANSHMKHSAGCPYKCKSCFKACLVSEDYVQQAKEWYRQNKLDSYGLTTKNQRAERPNPPRKNNAIAIVNRALARSQPLFSQVYGPGSRTKVKAWPQYGWVDIKQQVKISQSKEQEDCGEASDCNESTEHCTSSSD